MTNTKKAGPFKPVDPDQLLRAADNYTQFLAKPTYRPSRAHIEEARNLLRKAYRTLTESPTPCTCTLDTLCPMHAPRTSSPTIPASNKVLSEEDIKLIVQDSFQGLISSLFQEQMTGDIRQRALEEALAVAEAACEEYSTAEHVIGAIRRLTQPEPAPEWTGPGETPHTYSPDYMAMGDCRICGHTRGAHK